MPKFTLKFRVVKELFTFAKFTALVSSIIPSIITAANSSRTCPGSLGGTIGLLVRYYLIEQLLLDTYAGKQMSQSCHRSLLTLVLKMNNI
jgi:hypothetical protein